jgi:hypothetical protein
LLLPLLPRLLLLPQKLRYLDEHSLREMAATKI